VLSAERGRALDGVGWDKCERYAEWCGLRNGVAAEGGEVGGLRAAAVGAPRQGARWHEAGRIASSVMSGAQCKTVRLLRGVVGAVGERQPWGTDAGRWVAWVGMRCECCAGWRAVRDSVLQRGGALGIVGGVDVGCRGKVLRAPCQWDSARARRGRAEWCGVRSTACSVR
jgi:hypothetical protein